MLTDPAEAAVVNQIEVRLARPEEEAEWDRQMAEYHYLKSAQMVGEQLRYVAESSKADLTRTLERNCRMARSFWPPRKPGMGNNPAVISIMCWKPYATRMTTTRTLGPTILTLAISLAALAVPCSISAINATEGGALPKPLPLLPPDNWWNRDICT